jgi:hypothetical protein
MYFYKMFSELPIGHWTNGGTGITNFSKERVPLYEKAVELYNRYFNDELWIESGPMAGTHCDGYSLHAKRFRDISEFWDIFYALKEGKDVIEVHSLIISD